MQPFNTTIIYIIPPPNTLPPSQQGMTATVHYSALQCSPLLYGYIATRSALQCNAKTVWIYSYRSVHHNSVQILYGYTAIYSHPTVHYNVMEILYGYTATAPGQSTQQNETDLGNFNSTKETHSPRKACAIQLCAGTRWQIGRHTGVSQL